jgi:hypothetical protein
MLLVRVPDQGNEPAGKADKADKAGSKPSRPTIGGQAPAPAGETLSVPPADGGDFN